MEMENMPSYYEQVPLVGENAKRNFILEPIKPCFFTFG